NRTGEIGVRMALGARPADVRRLVLREGLTPVAIGLGLGVAGSLAVGRGIESLLFGVRPGDPLTIAAVGVLLGMVAVVACVGRARRAPAMGLTTMLRRECPVRGEGAGVNARAGRLGRRWRPTRGLYPPLTAAPPTPRV